MAIDTSDSTTVKPEISAEELFQFTTREEMSEAGQETQFPELTELQKELSKLLFELHLAKISQKQSENVQKESASPEEEIFSEEELVYLKARAWATSLSDLTFKFAFSNKERLSAIEKYIRRLMKPLETEDGAFRGEFHDRFGTMLFSLHEVIQGRLQEFHQQNTRYISFASRRKPNESAA